MNSMPWGIFSHDPRQSPKLYRSFANLDHPPVDLGCTRSVQHRERAGARRGPSSLMACEPCGVAPELFSLPNGNVPESTSGLSLARSKQSRARLTQASGSTRLAQSLPLLYRIAAQPGPRCRTRTTPCSASLYHSAYRPCIDRRELQLARMIDNKAG